MSLRTRLLAERALQGGTTRQRLAAGMTENSTHRTPWHEDAVNMGWDRRIANGHRLLDTGGGAFPFSLSLPYQPRNPIPHIFHLRLQFCVGVLP